ncbi:DUF4129 domain-containing protein [Deinococcus sp. Arct2-2]|uniref:DUF4129 domain-containing protein n=1 Tax=Deinococcus sp. Arct2-2 TaxID=2568653 RepID=UPI0010A3365D|nr:DUF4129 domain-containing protein [Deinococcus sp. Arct2-2]THF68559.1 DUF4129 domain-containing protein [Deinococcus sp. Arct2-2]
MSAPNALLDDQITPEEAPHTPPWQAYGAALLPLALLGVLPVWACLVLCLLFGLGVRSALWREGRLLISFLIVGGAILGHLLGLGGLSAALRSAVLGNLLVLYLAALLGAAGLYWGAALLEEGRRRGLWLVLAVGLVSPQPLLLLALAGGALMRPGQDDRRPGWLGREGAGWTGKTAAWLALPVALALAVAFALPQPAPLWNTSPVPPAQAQAGAEVLAPNSSSTASTPATPQATAPRPRPRLITEDVIPAPPAELLAVAGILVVLALFLLLRVIPARRGRPATLVEWLMGAGLVLTLVLAVVLVFGSSTGGSGGGLAPVQGAAVGATGSEVQAPTAEERRLTSFLNLVLWAALLFYLAVFALLVHTALSLRGASRRDAQAALPPEPAAPDAAALHRVRVAYRNAETALEGTGRGRATHETPQGYAARLAAELPTLAAPLLLLARVYAPVRYGGSISTADADAAETAEQTIRAELLTLPPVAPTEEAE